MSEGLGDRGFLGKPTAFSETLIVALSDLATPIVVANNVAAFRSPWAFTLTGLRISLTGASAGGTPVEVDMKMAGVSVLSTTPKIDNGETSSVTGTPAVIATSAIGDDQALSFDIVNAGSGATGLVAYVYGTRVAAS